MMLKRGTLPGFYLATLGWIVAVLASCGFPRPADVMPPDGGDDAPGATECQLTAIRPSLANTNDTIAVEGTFMGSVTVTFPGGMTVPATVLGPHRATVTVPASATEGNLTVTTCDATLGPLPFRRASFPVAVASFGAIYDQSSGARQAVKLATAREGLTAVVVGQYLYVLGGTGSTGALASVEQARINADGSLGPFASPGISLAAARRSHTTVSIGSYLYVVGGDNNGPLKSIERAVARDDSLGPFALVPDATLTTGRRGHASVVVGNSLYVLGGTDGSLLDSIERAIINADGSLGQFATVSDVHLATPRYGHTAAVVGGYLYVVGGTGGNGVLGDVERAAIGADGSLGPFRAVAGAALVTARSGHTMTVLGNGLYVFGGIGNGGLLSSVERAPLDADSSPGAFVALPATLLTARHSHATVVVENYLYSLGGLGSNTLSSVEWARIDASGSLGTPALAGVTLAAPRVESAAVVVGNQVYLIGGGLSASSTVERATINADGTLGSFAIVPGVNLGTPRRRHTAAVIGNYVYVIGGSGTSAALKTIERAPINPDGSLGAFADTVSLTGIRTAHTSAVIGSGLYVIGGNDGTNPVGSVERATINADGSLGSFATVSGVSLRTARQGHRSIVTRNALYILGGDDILVERASIDADGSLGSFATVPNITLNDGNFEATCTIVGRTVYVLGGDGPIALANSATGTINLDGSMAGFGTFPPVIRRFGHAAVLVGNYVYVLGGTDNAGQGLETSVSFMTSK